MTLSQTTEEALGKMERIFINDDSPKPDSLIGLVSDGKRFSKSR